MMSSQTRALIAIDDVLASLDNRQLKWLAVVLALGNAADAIEISSIGYVMNELNYLTALDKEWLSAAVFMGMLVGGVVFGLLSDHIGRKTCLLQTLALNAIGGICSAFCVDIRTLILCRIIGGIGIGGSVPSVFTLGGEIFPATKRGQMLSIIASFWMVGNIYTSLIGWLLLGNTVNGENITHPSAWGNWRIFVLICAIPVVTALILVHQYVPESPLYLLDRGNYPAVYKSLKLFKKSKDVLPSWCGGGDDDVTPSNRAKNGVGYSQINGGPVSNIIIAAKNDLNINDRQQPQEQVDTEADLVEVKLYDVEGNNNINNDNSREAANTINNGEDDTDSLFRVLLNCNCTKREVSHSTTSQHSQSSPSTSLFTSCYTSLADTCKQCSYYKRSILLLTITWYMLSFGTYGITLWINVIYSDIGIANVYAASFLYSIANIPGNWYSYVTMDVIGRRKLLVVSMLLCCVVGILFAISAGHYNQIHKSSSSHHHHSSSIEITTAAIIITSMAYSAISICSWNALDCISVEICPGNSNIRNTVIGLMTAFGRIGAVSAQFVYGTLEGRNQITLLFTVTAIAMLIGACSSNYLPETKNINLHNGTNATTDDDLDTTTPNNNNNEDEDEYNRNDDH